MANPLSGDVHRSASMQVRHDRAAPFWAAALILLGVVGLSTGVVDLGAFWKGYVLDITGPAWNYVLVRRLASAYVDNAWTRLFAPTRTLLIFIAVCYGIETAQYLELYEATFDPWDYLAYVAVLIPLYLTDVVRRRLRTAS